MASIYLLERRIRGIINMIFKQYINEQINNNISDDVANRAREALKQNKVEDHVYKKLSQIISLAKSDFRSAAINWDNMSGYDKYDIGVELKNLFTSYIKKLDAYQQHVDYHSKDSTVKQHRYR
jgi:hypothetical protein